MISKKIRMHTFTVFFSLMTYFNCSFLYAAEKPYRPATEMDIQGIWKQVGVIVLDPNMDASKSWFRSKQFFWFLPKGGYKHLQINPDKQPEFKDITTEQKAFLEQTPVTQHLRWHSDGIALLKHPKRPELRVDLGIYTKNMDYGPLYKQSVKPKLGDLVVVYYSYKDPNKVAYYRLLRRDGVQ